MDGSGPSDRRNPRPSQNIPSSSGDENGQDGGRPHGRERSHNVGNDKNRGRRLVPLRPPRDPRSLSPIREEEGRRQPQSQQTRMRSPIPGPSGLQQPVSVIIPLDHHGCCVQWDLLRADVRPAKHPPIAIPRRESICHRNSKSQTSKSQ